MSRETLIAEFLARHGYGAAQAAPLAQDASFRRYVRLTGGRRPAVLMDAPPPEEIGPFIRVGAHLAAVGISVPEVFAADEGAGLLLEEDLGDALISTIVDCRCGTPSPTLPHFAGEGVCQHSLSREAGEGWGGGLAPLPDMFDAAVDTLVAIQRTAPPPALPVWDAAMMANTALATICDWWWPAMFGAPAPDEARHDFAVALEATLAPVAAGPTCFVHRDFFVGNLIWLPQRQGIRRIGVLDFQGAAIGHPAYDLASLLQDARRDIPSDIADQAIVRYLAARPELDPTAFRAAYAACAAQRHLRIAGQWVRLARRDGRPGYLRYGPRTWRLLEQAVQEPAAAPLGATLDRWIPPTCRRNPPDLGA